MKKLPIDFKLSAILVLTGVTLIYVYGSLTRKVFVSDKTSYVQESQIQHTSTFRKNLTRDLENILATSRSLASTYDQNFGSLNESALQVFRSEKLILSLELLDEEKRESIFRINKQNQLTNIETLPTTFTDHLKNETLDIQPLRNNQFLLQYRFVKNQTPLRLRTIFSLDGILPAGDKQQIFLLVQYNRIIFDSSLSPTTEKTFDELLSHISLVSSDKTLIWKNRDSYFVAVSPLAYGDLRLVSIIPEKNALGALDTFSWFTLIFILIASFGLVILITTVIKNLTFEVKKLLATAKADTHIEGEKKITDLVQQNLLPKFVHFENANYELNGHLTTTSTYTGSWWSYFVRDEKIYIALAESNERGSSASFFAAASKAIFTHFEKNSLTLNEMMISWKSATQSCFEASVNLKMTLVDVNLKTGEGHFLCSDSQKPFLFDQIADGYDWNLQESLNGETNIHQFQMRPNSHLVLFSEQVFLEKNIDIKKFAMSISGSAEFNQTSITMTDAILRSFEEIPQDLTVITIKRKGPRRHAELFSEIGDMIYFEEKKKSAEVSSEIQQQISK